MSTEKNQERSIMEIVSDLKKATDKFTKLASEPVCDEPDWMVQAKDARLEALEAEEDEHNTNTLYGATDE